MKNRPKTRPPLPMVTRAAFDRATKKSLMSADNLDRARRVLVDGARVIEVAEDDGVSRQRIYQIIERVLARI